MYSRNIEFEKLLETNPILVKSTRIISKLAKENSSIPFYEEHFIPCAKICFEMSDIKRINKIDAILTGLFHDVGKFMLKGEIDNHEIIGAEYAEDFLRENNYKETKIQLIKHAIMNHRKNANDDFDQMSKLIIKSDIISYILHKKYFFEYLLKFTNQDEANQTVNKKISDSYARMDDDGKRLIFDLLIKSI